MLVHVLGDTPHLGLIFLHFDTLAPTVDDPVDGHEALVLICHRDARCVGSGCEGKTCGGYFSKGAASS